LVHAFYERKGVALNELTGGRTVFESLRFAIIDNVKRLFYIASISLLIFILGWFPPFLLLVLFLSFLVAGFDGMDLPLQLRGLTIRERLRFARVHWTTTLILGCCYSMTLVVPLLGIVALPLSYFVAVELDCASGDGVLKA
ncbi:MAG: hypothetical protein KDD62_14255, partial [Bdellovibrionales bacterium]|nr:hypothetical protein [Bdellovibrionales bacterium]